MNPSYQDKNYFDERIREKGERVRYHVDMLKTYRREIKKLRERKKLLDVQRRFTKVRRNAVHQGTKGNRRAFTKCMCGHHKFKHRLNPFKGSKLYGSCRDCECIEFVKPPVKIIKENKGGD